MALILWHTHSPHAQTIVTGEVVAVTIHAARIETQVVGKIGRLNAERARSIDSTRTYVVLPATPAVADGRKEQRRAIDVAGEHPAVNSIHSRPLRCAVINQLLKLVI